jgi:AcrR family transcriptional regulator
MPTTQVLKALNSREKVLKAATALFSARGFGGTSTRDVARRARVNETTLFRLFKSKQDLYLNVLDRKMGVNAPEWLLPVLQSSLDPASVCTSLAERLQGFFDPMFTRLLFFAALEKPEMLRKRVRPRLLGFYEMLGGQIQARIDAGVLRKLDPDLMGRAFVAMIAYHKIFCELLGGCDFPECNRTEFVQVYTDIWLHGVDARSDTANNVARKEGDDYSVYKY